MWNKRRNDGKYPDVPKLVHIVTPPTPWPDALITNFAGYINGRLCLPPVIQGTYLFFFSATQKTNTFKALSFQPSFLNVYYSSAIFEGADPMLFNKALLDKEAKAHGLYIRPSKFKHAGMGLFAAQGP